MDHYGIRTGFASSEINYIVVEKYDTRIGLEIAMNGFYIPVADKDGKIVFTPEDYKKLRDKMAGLSYFNQTNFVFSENLVTEEITAIANQIEESNKETKYKRELINKVILFCENSLAIIHCTSSSIKPYGADVNLANIVFKLGFMNLSDCCFI